MRHITMGRRIKIGQSDRRWQAAFGWFAEFIVECECSNPTIELAADNGCARLHYSRLLIAG
jgi:hypothetical protein